MYFTEYQFLMDPCTICASIAYLELFRNLTQIINYNIESWVFSVSNLTSVESLLSFSRGVSDIALLSY